VGVEQGGIHKKSHVSNDDRQEPERKKSHLAGRDDCFLQAGGKSRWPKLPSITSKKYNSARRGDTSLKTLRAGSVNGVRKPRPSYLDGQCENEERGGTRRKAGWLLHGISGQYFMSGCSELTDSLFRIRGGAGEKNNGRGRGLIKSKKNLKARPKRVRRRKLTSPWPEYRENTTRDGAR